MNSRPSATHRFSKNSTGHLLLQFLLLLFLLGSLALTGCESKSSEGAYYTCFGGIKVKSLSECDFSFLNISLEKCDKIPIYETASIITNENDVEPAFNAYVSETGKNYTFVTSEYYKMIRGKDYYRFNFFDYETHNRRQQFMDDYGIIFETVNCTEQLKE